MGLPRDDVQVTYHLWDQAITMILYSWWIYKKEDRRSDKSTNRIMTYYRIHLYQNVLSTL